MRARHLQLALGLAAALALGACGDDGGDAPSPDASAGIDADLTAPDADPGAPDATPAPDAAPSAVVAVTCPGSPDATITTAGFAYSPNAVTISVGEIVRFAPTSGHDVNSGNGQFDVPLAGEGCFRFDVAGSYGFSCTPHGFTGTITVE